MKLYLCVDDHQNTCGLFLHPPYKHKGIWTAGFCNHLVTKCSLDYARKYYPFLNSNRVIEVEWPFKKIKEELKNDIS